MQCRYSCFVGVYAALNFRLCSIIGIAGLSTAVSLGRRGHSILVLESTKEVRILEEIPPKVAVISLLTLESQLQSIGAGLGLTPPTKQWYECEYLVSSS